MRTSKAIFYCAHHAIGMMSIALKGKYYIHKVFKKFGTCEVAVFSDMANDGYRGATGFCECDKVKATTTQLCKASWNGINVTAVRQLDGIKHKKIGSNAPCFFNDHRQIWLSKQEQMLTAHCIGAAIKSIGTHLDLRCALFAGGVEHPAPAPRKRRGGLQEQRALADTWIAANKRHAARDQTAAKDAIELFDPCGSSRNIVRLHFSDRLRAPTTARGGDISGKFKRAVGRPRGDVRRFGKALQSIPGAAIRTFAHPFRLNIAAFTTDEAGLDLCHWQGRV